VSQRAGRTSSSPGKDEKTGKEMRLTFNLKDIMKGKKADPPLREGDYEETDFPSNGG